MSPIYKIRCRACSYERELILTSSFYYARICRILECDRCQEAGNWKKLPTSANVHFKGNGFTPKFHKER